jgi:hypothetical protein
MSLNIFRTTLRNAAAAPLRRTAIAQAPNYNRALFRNTFNRKYSTPPPPQAKSGAGLYVGVGAVVALGLAYYFYDTVSGKEAGTAVKSGIQAAKVKVNFVPSKEDYIKVNQRATFFFLSVLPDFLCRYTIKLRTSLTKQANMMVHSNFIRVLSKPQSLHDMNFQMALTDPSSSVLPGMLLERTIRKARQVEGANSTYVVAVLVF